MRWVPRLRWPPVRPGQEVPGRRCAWDGDTHRSATYGKTRPRGHGAGVVVWPCCHLRWARSGARALHS